jgi:hypothetical protein
MSIADISLECEMGVHDQCPRSWTAFSSHGLRFSLPMPADCVCLCHARAEEEPAGGGGEATTRPTA